MKNMIICILFLGIGLQERAAGSSLQGIRQDTTRSRNRAKTPAAAPALVRDTTGSRYNNNIYNNGIKSAEYQNRGAEDRRDPNSADPNAIPDKRVPEERVLPPDPAK